MKFHLNDRKIKEKPSNKSYKFNGDSSSFT
jgi:hypothetical protein